MENTKQTARKKHSSHISSGASKKSIKIQNKELNKDQNKLLEDRIKQGTQYSQTKKKNLIKQRVNTPIEQGQTQISMKLMLMTVLDIESFQLAITSLIKENSLKTQTNKKNNKISVPHMYSLIKQYEDIFSRSYNDQIRFYIIAALWDQGLVNVGSIQEWQTQIKYELQKDMEKWNQTQLGIIDAARDQIMNQIIKQIVDINGIIENKNIQHNNQTNLNKELVIAIQKLQQQYYRQHLTLQHLLKSCKVSQEEQLNFLYETISNHFNQLDLQKVGSVQATRYIQKFKLQTNQKINKNSENTLFMIRKLSNNLHEYDKHTNLIGNSVFNSQEPIKTRLQIENVIQLLNRVYQSKGPNKQKNQQSVSVTYNTINYLLNKFQSVKKATSKNCEKSQKNMLKQRNKKVGLYANLEYIRHAATQIVNQNKLNGQIHLLKNELKQQYITQKNQINSIADNQPTFRYKTNQNLAILQLEKTAQKRKEQDKIRPSNDTIITKDNKNKQLGRQAILNSNFPQQRFSQKNSKTNQSKMNISFIPHKNFDYFTPKDNINFLPKELFNNYWQDITAYKTYPQQYHHINGKQLIYSEPRTNLQTFTQIQQKELYSNIYRQEYDKMLRERIMNEIKIVELERIRNRLKSYDIIFK